MSFFLQILASMILFLNKILLGRPVICIERFTNWLPSPHIDLSFRKQLGWIAGIAGLLILSIHIELHVVNTILLHIYNIGMITLCVYGFTAERRFSSGRELSQELRHAITIFFAFLSLFVFVCYDHETLHSWIKITMALAGLSATYFMAVRLEKTAWIAMMIAHVSGVFVFGLESKYIAGFQILSLGWAIIQFRMIPR